MLIRRGLLFFAAFSWLWAQAPAPKGQNRPATAAASTKAAAGRKTAAAKPASKPEPASKIEPELMKIIKTVSAKYKALDSYTLEAAIDSGRQVDEDARQAMSKADIKLKAAPHGMFSLEVVEEAEEKLPYKVISDGKDRWAYVQELKQYQQTPAAPASKPISATESDASGPLSGGESYAERLVRQLVPLLANIDKTTDNAFLRGNVLTLLGKPDENGHGVLLYVTLASEQGDVSRVSWYQSDGPKDKRMLVRTDFQITSFKEVKPVSPEGDFTFTPPAGSTAFSGATASVSPAVHDRN